MRNCLLLLFTLMLFKNLMSQTLDSNFSKKNNFILHKVSKGEGLTSIARKYNLSINEIIKMNNISLTKLKIDQIIKIPVATNEANEIYLAHANADDYQLKNNMGSFHLVKKGENLFILSKLYKINTSDLILINSLKDTILTIGQIIYLKESYINKSYIPWNSNYNNNPSQSILNNNKVSLIEEYVHLIIDTVINPVINDSLIRNCFLIINFKSNESCLIEKFDIDYTLPPNSIKINLELYNKLTRNSTYSFFSLKYLE